MPQITFILRNGQKKILNGENGQSIMELASKNHIETIEGVCGGCISCGTCHVHVHPDWWEKCLPPEGSISDDEEDLLDLGFHVEDGVSRLGCQIRLTDSLDGLILAIPGGRTKPW